MGAGTWSGVSDKLLVGIIGASPDRGWAKESHVPAVQGLAGFELAAVATNSRETATAAAEAFGAPAAYADAAELIHDRAVDVVAICVKAPDHRPLVLAALAAGKHVYCEWPLGRDRAEADEIAAAAQAAGVHAAVGLQTRMNPAARRAHELVMSGAIGRPLTVRVYASTVGFGANTPNAEAYSEKAENGVTLVTIQGAHALDLAIALLGELLDVDALATTQYPQITIGDDPAPHARTTPDHLLIAARLASGGALSVEAAGGRPPGTPFRLEVVGDAHVLALDGGSPRGFQAGRLRLSLDNEPQHVDEGEVAPMPDTVANVAGIYAALRDDIMHGTVTAPDFSHAARLARLVEDVLSSARTGTRRSAAGWPSGAEPPTFLHPVAH